MVSLECDGGIVVLLLCELVKLGKITKAFAKNKKTHLNH